MELDPNLTNPLQAETNQHVRRQDPVTAYLNSVLERMGWQLRFEITDLTWRLLSFGGAGCPSKGHI